MLWLAYSGTGLLLLVVGAGLALLLSGRARLRQMRVLRVLSECYHLRPGQMKTPEELAAATRLRLAAVRSAAIDLQEQGFICYWWDSQERRSYYYCNQAGFSLVRAKDLAGERLRH